MLIVHKIGKIKKGETILHDDEESEDLKTKDDPMFPPPLTGIYFSEAFRVISLQKHLRRSDLWMLPDHCKAYAINERFSAEWSKKL